MLTRSSITQQDPNSGLHVHAVCDLFTESFLLPTSPKIDLTVIKAPLSEVKWCIYTLGPLLYLHLRAITMD